MVVPQWITFLRWQSLLFMVKLKLFDLRQIWTYAHSDTEEVYVFHVSDFLFNVHILPIWRSRSDRLLLSFLVILARKVFMFFLGEPPPVTLRLGAFLNSWKKNWFEKIADRSCLNRLCVTVTPHSTASIVLSFA